MFLERGELPEGVVGGAPDHFRTTAPVHAVSEFFTRQSLRQGLSLEDINGGI